MPDTRPERASVFAASAIVLPPTFLPPALTFRNCSSNLLFLVIRPPARLRFLAFSWRPVLDPEVFNGQTHNSSTARNPRSPGLGDPEGSTSFREQHRHFLNKRLIPQGRLSHPADYFLGTGQSPLLESRTCVHDRPLSERQITNALGRWWTVEVAAGRRSRGGRSLRLAPERHDLLN